MSIICDTGDKRLICIPGMQQVNNYEKDDKVGYALKPINNTFLFIKYHYHSNTAVFELFKIVMFLKRKAAANSLD